MSLSGCRPDHLSPAKSTFRAMLMQRGGRLGLNPAAIEALVEQSQITYWRGGQHIFAPDDAQDLTNFVVAGAVKVTCRGRHGAAVWGPAVCPAAFFPPGCRVRARGARRVGAGAPR